MFVLTLFNYGKNMITNMINSNRCLLGCKKLGGCKNEQGIYGEGLV